MWGHALLDAAHNLQYPGTIKSCAHAETAKYFRAHLQGIQTTAFPLRIHADLPILRAMDHTTFLNISVATADLLSLRRTKVKMTTLMLTTALLYWPIRRLMGLRQPTGPVMGCLAARDGIDVVIRQIPVSSVEVSPVVNHLHLVLNLSTTSIIPLPYQTAPD